MKNLRGDGHKKRIPHDLLRLRKPNHPFPLIIATGSGQPRKI
eukprot:gene1289-1482_t